MSKLHLAKVDLDPEGNAEYADEQDGALSETGPWSVGVWKSTTEGGRSRVVLQSDDFTHAVALEITGDFRDVSQKIRYANLLVDRMNRMPKE